LRMLHRTALLLTSTYPTSSPTPAIYPLSLHDALPISVRHGPSWGYQSCSPHHRMNVGWGLSPSGHDSARAPRRHRVSAASAPARDRKSTRLNSSHVSISYAVFCLTKKNNRHITDQVYA